MLRVEGMHSVPVILLSFGLFVDVCHVARPPPAGKTELREALGAADALLAAFEASHAAEPCTQTIVLLSDGLANNYDQLLQALEYAPW